MKTFIEQDGILVKAETTIENNTAKLKTTMLNKVGFGPQGQLVIFAEKEPMLGEDGLCCCAQGDYCPLGNNGSAPRCSREKLEQAGFQLRRKQ